MIGAKLTTEGIPGMQAVSNLSISAWLTAEARRGSPPFKSARGSQALIGRFETACIP